MSASMWSCLQAEEYEKLGSYALIGLPTELYKKRCVHVCSHASGSDVSPMFSRIALKASLVLSRALSPFDSLPDMLKESSEEDVDIRLASVAWQTPH